MSSTGLHEGQKGALANYLGPETGGNLLVGPTRWYSLESGSDSRNPKNNRQHRIDDHTLPQKLGCLVSGIDPIRSPFRTCSCPYCLVTSDYTWGCFHTHTCDWIEQLIASLLGEARAFWALSKTGSTCFALGPVGEEPGRQPGSVDLTGPAWGWGSWLWGAADSGSLPKWDWGSEETGEETRGQLFTLSLSGAPCRCGELGRATATLG